jgi:hypothetical protein
VVCVISCSGLFQVEPVAMERIIHGEPLLATETPRHRETFSKYFSKKALVQMLESFSLAVEFGFEF